LRPGQSDATQQRQQAEEEQEDCAKRRGHSYLQK
jgi:hypothetical protein